MKLFIPTRGRIGLNKQATLREFIEYSSYEPVLVCPKDEVKGHRQYWHRVIGCPKSGIGPTRQWILEHSADNHVVMTDDDMRFSYREVATEPKLSRCTDLDPMMALIQGYLDQGIIHGGIGARQGNNRKDLQTKRKGELDNGTLVVWCERVNNFHFVNRKEVAKYNGRLDALPVMEDFHFTLTLLTHGQKNVVIHSYVWNQEASGNVGGCSIYRTPQVQEAGAEGLKAAFPDFVKVVTKTSKDTSQSWKDFKERKDVIVYWVKAATAGGIEL